MVDHLRVLPLKYGACVPICPHFIPLPWGQNGPWLSSISVSFSSCYYRGSTLGEAGRTYPISMGVREQDGGELEGWVALWLWLGAGPWFCIAIAASGAHLPSCSWQMMQCTGQGRVGPGSPCLRRANGINMLGRGKNLAPKRVAIAAYLPTFCAGICTAWYTHRHSHTKDSYIKMMAISPFSWLPNFIGSRTFSFSESSIFFSTSIRFHRVKAGMSWNKQKIFWKKINLIFSDFTFFFTF